MLCPFAAAALLSAGCSAPSDSIDDGGSAPESVSETREATSPAVRYLYDPYSVYFDDSVPGVRTAVTVCRTTTARSTQVVECPAHFGYALVAGGFKTIPQNGQVTPLVTESYPVDSYFWRVRSQDHKGGESIHHLEVYTLGILLEGATVDFLRKVHFFNFFQGTNALSMTYTFPHHMLFSGGFFMNPGTFGTVSRGDGVDGWSIAGREQYWFTNDYVRLHVRLGDKRIIQDFGALEVQQKPSPPGTYFGPGLAGVELSATSGWVVAGWGGDSQTASGGAGRLLYAVGAASDAPDARKSATFSIDPWGASSGDLTEYHTEARKVPNSHGLCSTGARLSPSMDGCVESICAQDPFCCNNAWDGLCVAEVGSICWQSCDEFTCSPSSFDASYWSSEPPLSANCYGYALNTPVSANPGTSHFWRAGFTNDELTRALIGTGLLPSSKTAECPNGRTKIALAIRADGGDYHLYRKDTGSLWSHKFQGGPPKQTDDMQVPITDPELANVVNSGSPYFVQGYFCGCLGTGQGDGRHVISAPPGEVWPYPEPWEVPP
jgi:hypothetical protein